MTFYDKSGQPGEDDYCDIIDRLAADDGDADEASIDPAFLSLVEGGTTAAEDVADGFQVCSLGEDTGYYSPQAPPPPQSDEPPKPSTPEECADYLRRFFGQKRMHYGGPILDGILVTDRHVDMVLRLDLEYCVRFFHDCLDEQQEKYPKWKDQKNRLTLFFRLQEEAHALRIPKHHSGGLLLVYLILCLGYKL